MVVAIAAHILGPGAAAEDLADEILVDFLFGAVHRISHERAIESYLRLMTVRRALRRSHQEKKTVSAVQPEEAVEDQDAIELRTMLPRLALCLAKLTPKARNALRLRYQNELTTEH